MRPTIPNFIVLSFFFAGNASAAIQDTLSMEGMKAFYAKETGFRSQQNAFVNWSVRDRPFLRLYVSLPDRIEKPAIFGYSTIVQTEKDSATWKSIYDSLGYPVFFYQTYANSDALLNDRLMSYTSEAKCFIVCHELTHHYIMERGLRMPYEFNEALCDVIGNYLTLKFMVGNKALGKKSRQQLRINEALYRLINTCIERVNESRGKAAAIGEQCGKRIKVMLKNANSFQMDRFNYDVNNAYLLKNKYYSQQYFLLKQVFLRQQSTVAFMKIMNQLPDNVPDCIKYLADYK